MERRKQALRGFSQFYSFAVLMILAAALTSGCTREVKSKLAVRLNFSSDATTSAFSGEKLETVFINLRKGIDPNAPPTAFEFEMSDYTHIMPGGSVDFVIDKDIPPVSNLYVQYLGVFENPTNGLMRFAYGDAVVDASKAGDIPVNIFASMFGSATQQGYIGGRYFNSPTSGPSGILAMHFAPPGGKPLMEVKRSDIVNGWFTTFILDTVPLTYKVIGTNEVIFNNVTLGSAEFDTNITKSYLLKLEKPLTYDPYNRHEGGVPEADGASQYILGYFKNGAGPDITTYKACYSTVNETVDGSYIDANFLIPLNYDYAGSPSNSLRRMGSAGTNTSSCVSGVEYINKLYFYPQGVRSRDGDTFGFMGPFKIMDKAAPSQSAYLVSYIDTSTSPVSIELDWDYLPDTTISDGHLAGVTVFYKSHYGESGWDDDFHDLKTCGDLDKDLGYTRGPDIPKATTNYKFTNASGGGLSLNYGTPTNVWDWNFALCPYRIVGGVKKYFTTPARNSCRGTCSHTMDTFGRNASSPTLTINAPEIFDGIEIGGSSTRIVDVVSAALPNEIDAVYANVTNEDNWVAGDEVMLWITAQRGGGCGTNIAEGYYEFTQLKAVDTTSKKLTFSKGTVLDRIESSNIAQPANDPAFCYVQAVKVPHFYNLDVQVGGIIKAAELDLNNNMGGGVIAMRINGTLNLSHGTHLINADGDGYRGGDGTFMTGQSALGVNYTNGQGGGFMSGAGGGGGANYGSGGRGGIEYAFPSVGGAGGIGAGGMPSGGYGSLFRLFAMLGAGGGYGGDPSYGTGGHGGGFIFIAARKIQVNDPNAAITANGFSGQDGLSISAGGGAGAGGSVNILTRQITNLPLKVEAKGGEGIGTNAIGIAGGGGGGGYVNVGICATSFVNPEATGGARANASFVVAEHPSSQSEAGGPGFTDTNYRPAFCP